ncbi:MAG: hypothetical protein GX786_08770, partial [Clostridiales bacterium]|nr:hypothetical protein [Clostridiales bacterium]
MYKKEKRMRKGFSLVFAMVLIMTTLFSPVISLTEIENYGEKNIDSIENLLPKNVMKGEEEGAFPLPENLQGESGEEKDKGLVSYEEEDFNGEEALALEEEKTHDQREGIDQSHLLVIESSRLFLIEKGEKKILVDQDRVTSLWEDRRLDDEVEMVYEWSLSRVNLHNIIEEDVLILQLPTENCSFHYSQKQSLFNREKEEIGTYEITNQTVEIKLNAFALSLEKDLEGEFSVIGKVVKTANLSETEEEVGENIEDTAKGESFQKEGEEELFVGESKEGSLTDSQNLEIQPFADQTNRATITGVKVSVDRGEGFEDFINNGVVVPGAQNPIVGNGIEIEYQWEISKEQLEQMAANDEIYFNLPSDFYFFPNMAPKELKNGNEVLGTFEVVDSKIKVILNDVAIGKESLKNGFVMAHGVITDPGEDSPIDLDGNFPLATITIDPYEGKDPGAEVPNMTQTPMMKDGKQIPGDNLIEWSLNINNLNGLNRYNGRPFEILKSLYFVDELQVNQTLEKMTFKAALPTSTSGGFASYQVFYIDINVNGQFNRYDAPSGMSLPDYMNALKKRAGTWGVHEGKTLVVYFGDTPGDLVLPYSTEQALQQIGQLYSNGQLTEAQYKKTVEHYESGIEEKLIQFHLEFVTRVSDETPSQVINNNGKVVWE